MAGERPSEDGLIRDYFAPLARHPGAFGLLDDAAALPVPPGRDLVLTKDTLVAGVHFFPDDPADAIARKALRVNLSDLAGKGAEPAGFLLSIALHDEWTADWLAGFAKGLDADIRGYGVPLLGGDTVRAAGPLVVSITALGLVPSGAMVKRRGAKPGDWVVVTGTIGDAALGLVLRREPRRLPRLPDKVRGHLADRYLLPQPRTALAGILRTHASAAMDISDGFAGDLAKLTAASGVTARVETALLPLSNAAAAVLAAEPQLIGAVVSGGDDYEILATVPPHRLDNLIKEAANAGVAVAAVGEVVAGADPPLIYGPDGNAMTLDRASFSHF